MKCQGNGKGIILSNKFNVLSDENESKMETETKTDPRGK